jgi:hypothetical protein
MIEGSGPGEAPMSLQDCKIDITRAALTNLLSNGVAFT